MDANTPKLLKSILVTTIKIDNKDKELIEKIILTKN
jgi:hypothetical protein